MKPQETHMQAESENTIERFRRIELADRWMVEFSLQLRADTALFKFDQLAVIDSLDRESVRKYCPGSIVFRGIGAVAIQPVDVEMDGLVLDYTLTPSPLHAADRPGRVRFVLTVMGTPTLVAISLDADDFEILEDVAGPEEQT